MRHLCELLQALIEDARAHGLELSLEHMIARWAKRHSERVADHLAKLGVEVEGGGVVKQS